MGILPGTCDCGGPINAVDGSYWTPPETFVCGDCGRTEERILEEHDIEACQREDCGWCAFIKEEALA